MQQLDRHDKQHLESRNDEDEDGDEDEDKDKDVDKVIIKDEVLKVLKVPKVIRVLVPVHNCLSQASRLYYQVQQKRRKIQQKRR